jgi:hypothetical protein
MHREAAVLLAAVLAALVIAVATACGGDGEGGAGQATATSSGPLSLEEYFAGAERAWFAFAEAGASYREWAAAFEALVPPDEVAAEHAAYVKAVRELAEIGTPVALGTTVDGNAANQRAIDTCLTLQRVADERGIVAFLHCDPHTGSHPSDYTPRTGDTVDLTMEVLDGGEPRPGVDCTFTISSQPSDDAELQSEAATTDENGEATVSLAVGGRSGTIEVEGDCAGGTQTFRLEVG